MHVAEMVLGENALPETKLDLILSRDLRAMASDLTPTGVRYLVDLYYQLQAFRIASSNVVRSQENEPNALLVWFSQNLDALESRIPSLMKRWAKERREGRWAMSIHGIGEVYTAGLLASIDIGKAPTAGHIWSFCGLNPEMKWEKGEKRPFSARMKVLCWKIGNSFIKQSNNPKDIYGKVYRSRKEYEVARNESGAFNGYKLRTAKGVKIVDELPKFIIDARARRYAVKLFLSHLHHVMFECANGVPPPKPYILTRPEHAHFIAPPLWPCA